MKKALFCLGIAGRSAKRMGTIRLGLFFFFLSGISTSVFGTEPGTAEEPIRCNGKANLDFSLPDAGLNLVVGVQSYQIYRTSPNYPELSDGLGWRYHHHPMMTYWNGKFYSISAASMVDEDTKVGCVLLSKSKDGREWSLPRVVFPSIKYKEVNTLSNHRMGFYIAANGILLATTAYYPFIEKTNKEGRRIHTTDENKEYFGVAVREIKPDDSFGDIFFIVHNDNCYKKSELPFPYFTESGDEKLIEACSFLRGDPLVTLHWWEQIKPQNFNFPQSLVDFVSETGVGDFGKGISYYYRKDGALVALWKMSYAALSYDNGKNWTKPVKLKTLGKGFEKVWAQRTEDGKYAIMWNPPESEARYPIALATSEDGIVYDHMVSVSDEVYKRYPGLAKNPGPCNYQRGFYQKAADPPGTDMWVTYSMSKEDIWISRVPVPIRSDVIGNVNDNFDNMETTGAVKEWNIYHPKWAPVSIKEFPSQQNKSLELKDRDPHDYAKAIRIFEETQKAHIQFKIFPKQNDQGGLEIEICDPAGEIFLNMRFSPNSKIYLYEFGSTRELTTYQPGKWYDFAIEMDATRGLFNLNIHNGQVDIKNLSFLGRMGKNKKLKRLVFRTGPYRGIDINQVEPESDKPLEKESIFYIDDVKIINKGLEHDQDK